MAGCEGSASTKFLMGTLRCNRPLENIALALYEADALGALYTGVVDSYHSPRLSQLRRMLKSVLPPLHRQLAKRRIVAFPSGMVHGDWTWEVLRNVAHRLGISLVLQNWCWDHGVFRLDRKCARLIQQPQFAAFLGVEHGCLFALREAQKRGKKTVLVCLSPHHSYRRKWVDQEYDRFPELLTDSTRRLMASARRADARRDEEANLADLILTNSMLTSRSLVEAGFPPAKMIALPHGAPPTIPDSALPPAPRYPLRFVYAGRVAVHKGVHYLLNAWNMLAPGKSAELHLYGAVALPQICLRRCDGQVTVHGRVPEDELLAAYIESSVLVFPTLYDGFGECVIQALARGLPVITTVNAGAADLIEDGKNGFRVRPRDVHGLAERMEWCIRHPDELLAMRRYALASARRRTWSAYRASVRRQLLGSRDPRAADVEEPSAS